MSHTNDPQPRTSEPSHMDERSLPDPGLVEPAPIEIGSPSARPEKTCALVVAIEAYDAATPIPGPATAADQFSCWLLRRGVPLKNIARLTSRIAPNPSPGEFRLIDADPDEAGRPALPPDGGRPTHDNVWLLLNEELIRLEENTLGSVGTAFDPSSPNDELLIIYWSGHGLLDSSGSRRVFFANTTLQNWLLLQLSELLDYLKSASVRFRNQIVIVDACANWGPIQKEYVFPKSNLPRRLGSDDKPPPKSQFVLLSVQEGQVALFPNNRSSFFDSLLPVLEETPSDSWPPPMKRVALAVQDKCRAKAEKTHTYIPIFLQDWLGNRITSPAELATSLRKLREARWKPPQLLPAATWVWENVGQANLLPNWLNLAHLQFFISLGILRPKPLERRMIAAAWKHQAWLSVPPVAFVGAVAFFVWWIVFAAQARDIVTKLTRPGVAAGQIRGILKDDYRGYLPFLRIWLAGRLDAVAFDIKPGLFEATTPSHQAAPLSAHRNAAILALAAAAAAERIPAHDFLTSDQPTARQYLIEGLSEVFPPETLIAWLVKAQADGDAGLACAIALALDGYGARMLSSIPVGDETFTEWLLGSYASDPDPGVHSTFGWLLLVKLGIPETTIRRTAEKAGTRVPTTSVGRRWCITPEGVEMASFPFGARFMMGDYQSGNSQNDAPRHCHEIDRAFALGIKEVTNLEIRNCPAIKERRNDSQSRRPEQPATFSSWDDAVRYCNWLNHQALPPLEDCYEEQQSSPNTPTATRMVPVANALSKNGYRLPTEAEWEYACRAGTESSFFFGNDPRLRVFYALIKDGETSPVGQFRPNTFGLYDTYSNVTEWCHDPKSQYQPRIDGCVNDDGNLGVKQAYQVRGGNPSSLHLANSFAREDVRYSNRLAFRGFRLARTLATPAPVDLKNDVSDNPKQARRD